MWTVSDITEGKNRKRERERVKKNERNMKEQERASEREREIQREGFKDMYRREREGSASLCIFLNSKMLTSVNPTLVHSMRGLRVAWLPSDR